jgi:hypothetical protein
MWRLFSLERSKEDQRDLAPEAASRIKSALEAAGVEFTNGGEPGVRLRKT